MKQLLLLTLLCSLVSVCCFSQNNWDGSSTNTYTSGGNVGIGTPAPDLRLHLFDNIDLCNNGGPQRAFFQRFQVRDNTQLNCSHSIYDIEQGSDGLFFTHKTAPYPSFTPTLVSTPLSLMNNGDVTIDQNLKVGGLSSSATMMVVSQSDGTLSNQSLPLDNQQLQLVGSNALAIENGNVVTLPGDDLGSHSMTQELITNGELIKFQSATGGSALELTNSNVVVNYGDFIPGRKFSDCGSSKDAWENVWSFSYPVPSDRRLKTDIKVLDYGLSELIKLNPVSYQYNLFKENGDKSTYLGLIAQEVQPIIPEVVILDRSSDNERLAIDYTKFVPVLINSVKELNVIIQGQEQKINELEEKLQTLVNKNGESTVIEQDMPENIVNGESYIMQNKPNPFENVTTISYSINERLWNGSAYIGIYTLNGSELKKVNLSEQKGDMMIDFSNLESGMFIYSLIVDGQILDSKRMVRSK